jgi:predicted neuraminidase
MFCAVLAVALSWLIVIAKAARMRAHDHERLPGWHGEIHSIAEALKNSERSNAIAECLRRIDSVAIGLGRGSSCELRECFRSANEVRRINEFSWTNEDGEGERDREEENGSRREVGCPGEAVSLYDKENALKDNYKHMASIERIPWKGAAEGNVIMCWQTSEKNEGSRQRIVCNQADANEEKMKFQALTHNGRVMRRDNKLDGGEFVAPVGDSDHGGAVWGPCVFANPKKTHEVWLFYSQSRTGRCGSRVPGMDYAPGGDILAKQFNVVSGTWSNTEKIILSQDFDDGIPKVTANKPIVLRKSGRWVLPYWNERAMLETDANINADCARLKGEEGAGVLLSDDEGQTWYPSETIRGKNTWLIENAVSELDEDDHLLMVFRTKTGFIHKSESLDGGQTWSEAVAMKDLPNPNSKIDMIRLKPSGFLALAFNDHSKKLGHGCSRCRTHLKIAISEDQGRSWLRVRSLETDIDSSLRSHYPTIVQRGCELLVAYSKFYKRPPKIVDSSIDYDELMAKQGIYVARVPLCSSQLV